MALMSMRVTCFEVTFKKLSLTTPLCIVFPGQRSLISGICCLLVVETCFNCLNQGMHLVGRPWGGAPLSVVQMSTCQESSLHIY